MEFPEARKRNRIGDLPMTIIQAKKTGSMRIQAALALVCASVLAALPTKAASITEPATVFYGKILGVGSGQPFLVTEGHLTWIIRR